jgi:hypothetical protein
MRFLPFTLAGAALVAPSALAAAPPRLEVGANFWGRYEARENYDRLGVSRGRFLEGDWLVYRARLDLHTTPLAIGDSGLTAAVFLSPQADGFWGNQSGTVATPNLGIYRGFLRLDHGAVTADFGRFDLNYGDALVIGDLRWHQTGRSFDGARARLAADDAWVDLFLTQVDEGLRFGFDEEKAAFAPRSNAQPLEGDVYFAGVYGSLGGLLGPSTTLEPYALSRVWLANGAELRPAVEGTFGVRARQRFGIVDVRLETGLQLGRRRAQGGANPEVFAWQADGEVGVTPTPGLRFAFEALYATGDDPETETLEAYDELVPTTHKWLGLMDIIGVRTNIASGVVHASWRSGPVGLKLDTHGFFRPRTADGQSGFAGVEADLNVFYHFGEELVARAMYAVFVPGSDHFFPDPTRPAADAVAHYGELQLTFSL